MFIVSEKKELIFDCTFVDKGRSFHVTKSWERAVKLSVTKDLVCSITCTDNYLRQLLEEYSAL